MNSEKTEAQLIEEGYQAKALLDSDAFNGVLTDLYETWKDAIVKTSPDDEASRKTYYNLCLAIEHITGALQQRYHQAQNVEEVLEEDRAEEDQDN